MAQYVRSTVPFCTVHDVQRSTGRPNDIASYPTRVPQQSWQGRQIGFTLRHIRFQVMSHVLLLSRTTEYYLQAL